MRKKSGEKWLLGGEKKNRLKFEVQGEKLSWERSDPIPLKMQEQIKQCMRSFTGSHQAFNVREIESAADLSRVLRRSVIGWVNYLFIPVNCTRSIETSGTTRYLLHSNNPKKFKDRSYRESVCVWPDYEAVCTLHSNSLTLFSDKKGICKTRDQTISSVVWGWSRDCIKKLCLALRLVRLCWWLISDCCLIVKKVTWGGHAAGVRMQIHTEDCFFHISMFFRWAFVKWSQTFLWLAAVNTRSIWLTVDDMVACCIQKHNKSSVVYPAWNSTFVLV